MQAYWQRYHTALQRALEGLQVTNAAGVAVPAEDAFTTLCSWSCEVADAHATMHIVGNGASAAMASHMALDWSKNGRVRTTAHNDLAALTALGNDLGYDQVFARQLEWHARAGDLLVSISSSGNSANILRAIAAARAKQLRIVTLSGLKPDNKSRTLGDLNLYVAAWSYGIVECAHQTIMHAWLDCHMKVCEWELTKPQTF
jgi:D-sedoheptulose 7-phosphate isomerase